MNVEEEIKLLINDFDGKVHLYISDEKGNIIKLNENEIVETASCIKLFILILFYLLFHLLMKFPHLYM